MPVAKSYPTYITSSHHIEQTEAGLWPLTVSVFEIHLCNITLLYLRPHILSEEVFYFTKEVFLFFLSPTNLQGCSTDNSSDSRI